MQPPRGAFGSPLDACGRPIGTRREPTQAPRLNASGKPVPTALPAVNYKVDRTVDKWAIVAGCAVWAFLIVWFITRPPPDPKEVAAAAARQEQINMERERQYAHRCDDWREWAYSWQHCADKLDEWELEEDRRR